MLRVKSAPGVLFHVKHHDSEQLWVYMRSCDLMRHCATHNHMKKYEAPRSASLKQAAKCCRASGICTGLFNTHREHRVEHKPGWWYTDVLPVQLSNIGSFHLTYECFESNTQWRVFCVAEISPLLLCRWYLCENETWKCGVNHLTLRNSDNFDKTGKVYFPPFIPSTSLEISNIDHILQGYWADTFSKELNGGTLPVVLLTRNLSN